MVELRTTKGFLWARFSTHILHCTDSKKISIKRIKKKTQNAFWNYIRKKPHSTAKGVQVLQGKVMGRPHRLLFTASLDWYQGKNTGLDASQSEI